MKFKRRVHIEKGIGDLTPLVNVFFLLLIFFMFTSSFIFQPGIAVTLPKALTGEIIQQETVTIVITADDRIFLNDREVTTEELASNFRIMAQEETALLLRADSRASLGRIVEVWDMCRAQGVSRINIATGG